MLRNLARTALLAVATSLALIPATPAEATSKHLTILASVPDLAFPFFVYMMGQIKDEANRLGDITVVESDGQRSSPKQSADLEAAITKGVDGIVIDPNDFDALAPALQEAITPGSRRSRSTGAPTCMEFSLTSAPTMSKAGRRRANS